MKIVHTIHTDARPLVFSRAPTTGSIRQPPQWEGAHVELTLFSRDILGNDEVLDIEGQLLNVIKAFEDSLLMLKSVLAEQQAEVQEAYTHSVQCADCSCWFDSRKPFAYGHGDGHGNVCIGEVVMVDENVWDVGTDKWSYAWECETFTLELDQLAPVKFYDGHATRNMYRTHRVKK